jgi:hypothetical protein
MGTSSLIPTAAKEMVLEGGNSVVGGPFRTRTAVGSSTTLLESNRHIPVSLKPWIAFLVLIPRCEASW